MTASSAQAPTSASVNEFMNPFIQNVIDVQTREALRQGDVERQNIGSQAVQAGGFGGSRHAILEAEQARNLQQRLEIFKHVVKLLHLKMHKHDYNNSVNVSDKLVHSLWD